MTVALVLLCILFAMMLAAGQLLFKLGAGAIASAASGSWWQMLFSPYLIGAIVLYGFTTILWVHILTRTPLSSAYPFSLLGSMLVPVLAFAVLNEPLDLRYILGFALMCAGLLVANVR